MKDKRWNRKQNNRTGNFRCFVFVVVCWLILWFFDSLIWVELSVCVVEPKKEAKATKAANWKRRSHKLSDKKNRIVDELSFGGSDFSSWVREFQQLQLQQQHRQSITRQSTSSLPLKTISGRMRCPRFIPPVVALHALLWSAAAAAAATHKLYKPAAAVDELYR